MMQDLMKRFDETGTQLLSIAFLFCILCAALPVALFGPTEKPDFFCLFMTITIVLCGNVVIILNLLPRILAVFKGNENKYGVSAVELMKEKLKRRLSEKCSMIGVTNPTKRTAGIKIKQSSDTHWPLSHQVHLHYQLLHLCNFDYSIWAICLFYRYSFLFLVFSEQAMMNGKKNCSFLKLKDLIYINRL